MAKEHPFDREFKGELGERGALKGVDLGSQANRLNLREAREVTDQVLGLKSLER